MVKKIHAVGIIFENAQGQILVLKRHPVNPEGVTWGLVGGKLEAGEDRIAAAVREAREEIGYAINSTQLQFITTYHWKREDINLTFEVFRLAHLPNSVVLTLNRDEHTEHLWAHPEKLYRRPDLMMGLYPILQDVYNVG
jgi:8-oxo-dGTP pyrophosphatase MutT (NUDIX family)